MSEDPTSEMKPSSSGHGFNNEEVSAKSKVLSQREQEKKLAEDKRLREERDRKILEHKQRVKALTEAEY
jgi:hypothetical protein